MDNSPRCSVVIPTYNRVELLRYTLDSLTRQSLPTTQFEVMVVDDGSSDATEELAESYKDRLSLRYFFQEDEGWQVSRARNVGITNATSDVCVFVDSGVVLQSGCLAAHVQSHDDSDVPLAVNGYVYGFNLNNEDAELIAKAVDLDDPDTTIETLRSTGQWTDVREFFYAKYNDEFSHLPAPWVMYWACNVSARTEQLRAVGGYDEAFRTWGGEDLDLAYRLFLDGARFVLNRAAASIHYPHHKSFADNEAQAAANYRYMAEKYPTPIIQLLPSFGEAVNPFNINEVIEERGLPRCEDYLAQQGAER